MRVSVSVIGTVFTRRGRHEGGQRGHFCGGQSGQNGGRLSRDGIWRLRSHARDALTLAERERALAELRAGVEAGLADAEANLSDARLARREAWARLSREDVAAFKAQLAVLDEYQAWLAAGLPQEQPVEAPGAAEDGRGG